ncbi:Protein rrf2 [uncultured delta proteobacterium]|uniref:Protein rrf2 n=1 Tax=uncultured delta proteobacterium TaxID=34034 RepID=A0A212J2G0_9DELT|nr:Protein rrf2 [uncultured delta proteobacterium]
MKFTTRSRYGTQILLEVALHEEDGPVSLRDIAARLDVSVKYLEKLSKILREAGYLESIVGARGGYRLNVHPAAIRMGDVTFLLETGEHAVSASLHEDTDCSRVDNCVIRSIWTNAIQAMRDTLNTVSLEDMLGDACFCPGKPCHASSAYGFICSKLKKDTFLED